jgi:hypothetical protein
MCSQITWAPIFPAGTDDRRRAPHEFSHGVARKRGGQLLGEQWPGIGRRFQASRNAIDERFARIDSDAMRRAWRPFGVSRKSPSDPLSTDCGPESPLPATPAGLKIEAEAAKSGPSCGGRWRREGRGWDLGVALRRFQGICRVMVILNNHHSGHVRHSRAGKWSRDAQTRGARLRPVGDSAALRDRGCEL